MSPRQYPVALTEHHPATKGARCDCPWLQRLYRRCRHIRATVRSDRHRPAQHPGP
ncbi:SWIM zinc finger family protein [Streptomyces sp. NPDC001868]|uniref:SWIM zinc finger family protein n=1 Tax=Streptomyces sp. NPDC001868 TaxID=3154401 RepID=UPI003330E65C